MNHLSNEDAAYIAGLMDGEGYIGLIRNHFKSPNRTPSYHLKIEICNNCLDLLNWIKVTTGCGRIYKRKDSRASSWIISTSFCKDFLEAIYPYLRIKKLQTEVAFQYCKTVLPKYGSACKLTTEVVTKREELRSKIIELNSRYRSNNQVISTNYR